MKKKIKLSQKQWREIGKTAGWITAKFKSDQDIADEFKDMKIGEINIEEPRDVSQDWLSGSVLLEIPYAGESVGGGQECEYDGIDYWIFYNYKDYINNQAYPKIAFDHWYPAEVHRKLVNAILEKIKSK
jgi:hypothetical protein